MSDKKLHIVVIAAWMPTKASTSGIFTRDQCDALVACGNKVSIFMFEYYSLFAWLKKKLKGETLNKYFPGKLVTLLTYIFVNPFPTRFSSDPKLSQKKAFLNFAEKKFKKYIKQNGKPDVIHHHEIVDFCYITAHLSKKFDIPYIITEHSPYDPDKDHFNQYETKQERLEMIRNASLRIAVSTKYQKIYEKLFGAPFITLPNVVTKNFIETPLPPFPKQIKPFHFLQVGSYVVARRQNVLFRAFAGAFKNKPAVDLTIISSGGPLEGELRNLIRELNMEQQIYLVGYKSKDEIVTYQDKSNVLVVCSDMETFSVPAAEAITRGNPVLTTRCGGPEDFINETNGLFCNVNDVADMQEKLLAIYQKYPVFDYIKIRRDAIAQFSEEVVEAKLEELYRKVIKQS